MISYLCSNIQFYPVSNNVPVIRILVVLLPFFFEPFNLIFFLESSATSCMRHISRYNCWSRIRRRGVRSISTWTKLRCLFALWQGRKSTKITSKQVEIHKVTTANQIYGTNIWKSLSNAEYARLDKKTCGIVIVNHSMNIDHSSSDQQWQHCWMGR